MGLTPKQDQVWRFVTQYTSMYGRSPTLEEIADGVDLRAVSTVHKHLANLKTLGLIDKIPHGKRAITITGTANKGIKIDSYKCYKIYMGSQATEIDTLFPIFEELPQPILGLEVGDNAYEKYGIFENDWLIVHESKYARANKLTAIELINGVILIRKAVSSGGKIVFESLDAQNQLDSTNTKILGIVLRLVRKF